ncbi:UNVERIFIED_CONTAM: ABC transporter D family member 1 [Sesamum radiatum]|uniref:ABC transporter D family member 1 n=1 Tax=Sesamum radiatum TaxID=300843 RepID=A0AAW2VR95_SESRA
MPSLQLLQLTERGRGLLASRRKALILATSIAVVGGTATAAYIQSQKSSKRRNSFGHSNGVQDNKDEPDQLIGNDKNVKKSRQKRGNLRSLQVLAAILLSRMGRMGAMDFIFGGYSGKVFHSRNAV